MSLSDLCHSPGPPCCSSGFSALSCPSHLLCLKPSPIRNPDDHFLLFPVISSIVTFLVRPCLAIPHKNHHFLPHCKCRTNFPSAYVFLAHAPPDSLLICMFACCPSAAPECIFSAGQTCIFSLLCVQYLRPRKDSYSFVQ